MIHIEYDTAIKQWIVAYNGKLAIGNTLRFDTLEEVKDFLEALSTAPFL
jgi:hypothetical protein